MSDTKSEVKSGEVNSDKKLEDDKIEKNTEKNTESENKAEASTSEEPKEDFDTFYSEVKAIEKRDSNLTSSQQLDRLSRPGCTYFNLNPFDVLMVEPDLPLSEIKKKYRRMSILVHPDKNQDDVERAQSAFEAVNKAWKTLENEEGYKQCQKIVEEAKSKTAEMMKTKRKKLKRECKDPLQTEFVILEDQPEQYKHAVYVQCCKLFADLERYMQMKNARNQQEKKKKIVDDMNASEAKKAKVEWDKNYEESRPGRVNSWRDFNTGSKKKKSSKSRKQFCPPKLKTEERDK